jgi:hypothetical protein
MDTGRPRIDIVREREEGGDEPFKSDREAFSQQQAQIERDASIEQPTQEEPEEFRLRMEEKLKESGKDNDGD